MLNRFGVVYLVETTENIRGIFNPAEKNKGEEPIVIAQRYLNIFRQLHIFDDARKASFNQKLLELPAEIRGMFANLPGGSTLQEYVHSLEKKAGISHENVLPSSTATGASKEELSQAKILATALAEAQVQAAAQMQAQAPIMTAAPAGVAAAPSKIVADAAFAQEIAKALSAAIQHSDDNHRQEYVELVKAINASQEKIASLLTANRPVAGATVAPQEAAPQVMVAQGSSEDIAALTKAVNDSQMQMAKMFLQFYNSKLANPEKMVSAEITEAVTKAITDSQMQMAKMFLEHQDSIAAQMPVPAATTSDNVKVIDNSEAIIKAIGESQKEMAKLLMQNNMQSQSSASNNNANNIQINTAPNFPPLEDLVGGIVKAQSEIFREVAQNQTKELTSIIGLALKESQQISTKAIVEALKGFHEENLKFFETQAARTIAVPVYQTVTTAPLVSPAVQPKPQTPPTEEVLPEEEISDIQTAAEEPVSAKKK